MVKLIDMAWIADKSLDIYCEKVCSNDIVIPKSKQNSKSVSSSIRRIFEGVLDTAIETYTKSYDKLIIAVPCFPITRMNKINIISRFLCRNSEFLADNGVSSSQFQETFEKFIMLKCQNEYLTCISDRTYVLNGHGILFNDWKRTIIEKFGSSLVNTVKDFPFDSNPDFIVNFEEDESKFFPLSEEERFRISMIIDNLTKIN